MQGLRCISCSPHRLDHVCVLRVALGYAEESSPLEARAVKAMHDTLIHTEQSRVASMVLWNGVEQHGLKPGEAPVDRLPETEGSASSLVFPAEQVEAAEANEVAVVGFVIDVVQQLRAGQTPATVVCDIQQE